MTLNVDKLTLSEYRLTQNPIWQDVLANEIAGQIFEDNFFLPDEVKEVKEFMRGLGEDKRWHLEGVIRHREFEELKRQFFLGLALKNRFIHGTGIELDTPTAIMRERNESKSGCKSFFDDSIKRHLADTLLTAIQVVYNLNYQSVNDLGIFEQMGRDWIRLPIVSLNPDEENIRFLSHRTFSPQELCEELAYYCSTFECEGL